MKPTPVRRILWVIAILIALGLLNRYQKVSCLRFPVKRQSLFSLQIQSLIACRHEPVGQPQGQAIHHHQRVGSAVPRNGGGQIPWLFDGAQARHAQGAVALVARNALAHFVVPGLCRGNQHRAVVARLRQPVARQQLGAARLAAFLATQDEFGGDGCVRHGHRGTPPIRWATASGLEGNHA